MRKKTLPESQVKYLLFEKSKKQTNKKMGQTGFVWV
jgi:hypothetical protein